ncbi:MAG: hypothetical protein KKA05_09125, partial [Alphaproteobacteria bacterium]|nr:hypothetical protein [Alphaproteobacteria bacterium]
MNHPHAVPTYVENLSRMLQVHEHPKFDPAHMRALQARVAELFSAEPDFGGIHGLSQATLIQFRVPEHAGTQGSVPTNLVHIPLYFQEIRTFEPLSAGQLQQRLAFAKETGHLLIGRDEVLAILHESEGGHIFCNAFECNTDGVPRPLYGIHADNVVRASRSKRICDLNITETRRELAEFTGSMYQWAGQSLAFNSLQV